MCSTLACSVAPTSPPTPLIGMWAGNHISLVVSAAGSQIEFDCVHGGTPSPFMLDDRDAFTAGVTFVREHAGPIVVGQVLDSHPAVYFGAVTANTMALTVQLTDTRRVIGMFTLVRDTPGHVVKCLLPLSR